MRWALFTLPLALALGCARLNATPAPTLPSAGGEEVATRVGPAEPFTVGAAASAPEWLEQPCSAANLCADDDPTHGPTLLAAGADSAVTRTRAGQLFGFHRDRGISGPLAFPGRLHWIEVMAGGRLVAGDSTGQVWTAVSLPAASSQAGWARLRGAPAAYVADASDTWLAMADRDEVFIARLPAPTPGSEARIRVTRSKPASGMAVQAMRVRRDGTLVVQLSRGRQVPLTMIRAGGSWSRSEYQPQTLGRRGEWIWNGDPTCPAVLSADSRGWTRAVDPGAGRIVSWLAPFQVTHHLSAFPVGTHRTAPHRPAAPAAPVDGDQRVTATRPCEGWPSASGRADGLGRGPCRGVACLAGTIDGLPVRTRSHAGLFGDGTCAEEHRAADGACRPSAPLLRPPKAAVSDRRTGQVTVRALPPGCHPQHLQSVRGLAILSCRGGTRFASQANIGRWHFEGRVHAGPPWAATMGWDGTLMQHLSCPRGRPCEALVRRPVPAGTPDAWRRVRVSGAVAYRVGLGGHAMGVTALPYSADSFMIHDLAPDGATRQAVVTLPPDPAGPDKTQALVGLSTGASGSAVLRTRPIGSARREPLHWTVRRDGALAVGPRPGPSTLSRRAQGPRDPAGR